jgi:hypothetical protein
MIKKLLTLFFIGFLISSQALAASKSRPPKKLKYRTSFGSCPSRTAGTLSLKLLKTFERTHSLREVKRKIVEDKLKDKHFISSYKIKFHPAKGMLELSFQCPLPLMKAQIYKANGVDSYEAILVDNGKLFDPTYEVLLRAEEKLAGDLPFLALPVGDLEAEVQDRITHMVKQFGEKFRSKISEVILSENRDLTIILSVSGNPSSVFLGTNEWEGKVDKLMKIINFMEAKGKIPAIINLTNSKKVVVKFNSKI